MRLKRRQTDFRLAEILASDLGKEGGHRLYQVTKRAMPTREAVALLAQAAGVDTDAVSVAGDPGREGVTSQFMTIEGGPLLKTRSSEFSIRPAGGLPRPIQSSDVPALAVDVVLRDLSGDDMRRIRHHLAEVKGRGLVAYYDDPRFGCLRHGQGFVVKKLLRGDVEGALKSLLAAPSPYGVEHVEKYKEGIRRRWGDWKELAKYTRGSRGSSAFAHLAENDGDFEGALRVGVSSRERTMHLFAYQSHLWNRVASLLVRKHVPAEQLTWIPTDDGALPLYRMPEPDVLAHLASIDVPLFGVGFEATEEVQQRYDVVFQSEGIDPEKFLALDLPGFRPKAEARPLVVNTEFLRVAPAERDDLYRMRHMMRIRFEVQRGHHPTLMVKRLAAAVEDDARPPVLWVSRHRLVFPDANGRMEHLPEGHRRFDRDDENRDRYERPKPQHEYFTREDRWRAEQEKRKDTPFADRDDRDQKPHYRGEDRERAAYGDRKPPYRGEDRKPFHRDDRGGKPPYRGDDRKSYGRDDRDRKPHYRGEDRNQGDRKPHYRGEDRNQGDRKPHYRGEDRPQFGRDDRDRKPHYRGEDRNQGDRKPHYRGEDRNQGDRKPHYRGEDRNQGDRKPHYRGEDRPQFGRDDRDRKPHYRGEDRNQGDRKPHYRGEDRNQGDRKPHYRGEDRNQGDRKPHYRGEDRPQFGRDDRDRKPHYRGEDRNQGDRKPHYRGEDRSQGDRKPHYRGEDRNQGDRKPHYRGEDRNQGDRKPHYRGEDRNQGDRKPHYRGEDRNQGDRKPHYRGEDRNQGDRKPHYRGEDRPQFGRDDRDRKSHYRGEDRKPFHKGGQRAPRNDDGIKYFTREDRERQERERANKPAQSERPQADKREESSE